MENLEWNKRIEGNKKIAKFMGGIIRKPNGNFVVLKTPDGRTGNFVEHLKYHEEWNWIMPVAEKIGEMHLDGFPIIINISTSGISIRFNPSNCAGEYKEGELEIANTLNINYFILEEDAKYNMIQSVWECIVRFIDWYNKREENEKEM